MLCVCTIIITKEEIMNFEGWEELGVRVMDLGEEPAITNFSKPAQSLTPP